MARKRGARSKPHKQSRTTASKPVKNPLVSSTRRQNVVLVSVFLSLAVVVVFGQAVNFDFVSLDDPDYVIENPAVNQGLSKASVRWAFTSVHASNWHPLTWISHMVDCELFGLDPGGHHAINVLFHLLATLLLFIALKRLTDCLWPSALVATLFAIHPLRAESVAWVAERKDVLSGFFAMAVLLLWLGYVKRPSWSRYLSVAVALALGLLSKAMLVTLPFVLLLLDVWPLGRMSRAAKQPDAPGPADFRSVWWIIAEKLPFVALAIGSALTTVLAQRQALSSLQHFTFADRVANALTSWVAYIWMSLLPTSLAMFYPHPSAGIPLWQVVLAGLVIVAVSVVVIRQIRIRPFLAVGWFWYLGTLVPVIGLLQVGSQAMADRYTYIPQIGLWIMVAWGLREAFERLPQWKTQMTAGVGLVIVLAMVLATLQVNTWRSSEALYRHALANTEDNWMAHANLAEVLILSERFDEGATHAAKAVDINPDNHIAALLLGNAMIGLQRPSDAVDAYLLAHNLRPDFLPAVDNLGKAYRNLGDTAHAIQYLREALILDPMSVSIRVGLGNQLIYAGDYEAAAEVLCSPEFENVSDDALHFNCGLALAHLDRSEAALVRLQKAAEINPREPTFWTTIATVLDRLGRAEEAQKAAQQARRYGRR
ncbi:MAG: tetratricopeptide repeat protein [bacterium]|nr:tetratricopeptide repeat protein [bacterium]